LGDFVPEEPKVLVFDDRICLFDPRGEPEETSGNAKPCRVTLEQAKAVPGQVAIFSVFANKDFSDHFDSKVAYGIEF
jgi:hypothetical protein